MSTQRLRMSPRIRGCRRRKAVLDLNLPPIESRDQEGMTSTEAASLEVQSSQQGRSVPPTMIDVEAIVAYNVIESSPTTFAEDKRKRSVVVDLHSGRTTRSIINCDLYINLESSSNSTKENVPKPPPAPKEPPFSCPICMGPLVEEMSTKCGHIFCKACIKAAIAAQAKCPTCRKKVTVKELLRVFLPSTS